jgi:hypothetical protein
MYVLAGKDNTCLPSEDQKYSCPPLTVILGHDSTVQDSRIVPYNMLTWLKKSITEEEQTVDEH